MKTTLQFESSLPDVSSLPSDSLVASIGEIRDRMFRGDPLTHVPDFVRRPELQLTDYAARREASPLGQVFQVANGLHDHLDAVVVVGCDESISGIRAITDACCDPYHNELSRAARGSKPRLYFAGSRSENDAISSLLNRLINGGNGGTKAESRFAIVAVGYPGNETGVQTALPHIVETLKGILGEHVDEWLPRLVIPICHPQSRLPKLLTDLSPSASFELPASDDPARDVLSPVGLLPAAFLGLDCMKLLEGAYAITEQFRTADFQDNLVMRYVAGESKFDCDLPCQRMVRNWNPALDSLELWHRALGRKFSSSNDHPPEHWSVRSSRTDSLFDEQTSDRPGPPNQCSLDELNESAILDVIHCPMTTPTGSASGATRLTLPHIDTYGIGQWIQLLLLAGYVLPHNQTR